MMGRPSPAADPRLPSRRRAREIVYPRCAAIDVHKATAVVTSGWPDERGQRRKETRTFGTMTADIERLVAWLGEHGGPHVAMESTGVYVRRITARAIPPAGRTAMVSRQEVDFGHRGVRPVPPI